MKISACLIACNEEKNIITWIDNARQYADEIIIMDTGSTDATMDLAHRSNVTGLSVDSVQWTDDFAAAKNQALSKAKGDWVVFLDADEFFYHPEAVRKKLSHVSSDVDGLLVPICNVDMDAGGREISRFPALRLWRNRDTYRFQGAVHEALYDEGKPLNHTELAYELTICHTGYSTHIITAKLARNLSILQKEIAQHGERPQYFRYLAECTLGLGEPELAYHYAKRAIEEEPPTVAGKSGLYHIALQAMEEIDSPVSEKHVLIDAAMQDDVKTANEFLAAKAQLLYFEGNWSAANKCLKEFFSYEKESRTHLNGTSYAIAQLPQMLALAGKIALQERDIDKAEELLDKALEKNPYQEEGLLSLFELCQNTGQAFNEKVRKYISEDADNKEFLRQWAIRMGILDMVIVLAPDLPMVSEIAVDSAREIYQKVLSQGSAAYTELFMSLWAGHEQISPRDFKNWKKRLPVGICHVLERLTGQSEQLIQADYGSYKALILSLRSCLDYDQLSLLLGICTDFSVEAKREIAKMLLTAERYEAAYALYEQIPAETVKEDGKFWYEVGKCLFHLRNEAAKECFQRANEYGCCEPDIEAYLAWISKDVQNG